MNPSDDNQKLPYNDDASYSDDTFSSVTNTEESVPGDKRIEPDMDLQGYQDDLDTSKPDEAINEMAVNPANEEVGMTPSQLRQELKEFSDTSDDGVDPDDEGGADDRREQSEDMNENDKEQY